MPSQELVLVCRSYYQDEGHALLVYQLQGLAGCLTKRDALRLGAWKKGHVATLSRSVRDMTICQRERILSGGAVEESFLYGNADRSDPFLQHTPQCAGECGEAEAEE